MFKPRKEIEKEGAGGNHSQRSVAGKESHTVRNLGLNNYCSKINYMRSYMQLGTPGLESPRGCGECPTSISCSSASLVLGGHPFSLFMKLSIKASLPLGQTRFVIQAGHTVPWEHYPQERVLISSCHTDAPSYFGFCPFWFFKFSVFVWAPP